MAERNLFDLAAELLREDPPPHAVSAWGFGSYARTPDSAEDVDLLLVFDNSAIQHREQIKPYCTRLQERFQALAGKQLHLERLTQKECDDVNFIGVASAVPVWSNEQQPES